MKLSIAHGKKLQNSINIKPLHSMARADLNKSVWLVTNTTAATKYIPRRPRISINWNPPFQTSLHKISEVIFFRLTNFFFRNKNLFSRNNFCSVFYVLKTKKNSEWSKIFFQFPFLEIYTIKKVWKGDFNWCWFWSS